MYYQTYMKDYYQKHKDKIKKQSREWAKRNPEKIRNIQKIYKGEHPEKYYREEMIEVLPFEKRVNKETLARMKENSQSNQGRIKYYKWMEDWIPKKRVLEGV